MNPTPQRGNILFLILLAVVLFAALSYAVTSQRDGGKNASGESAKSHASALLQYASLVENTVHRMVLVGGIKPEHLDFRATGIADGGAGTNSDCLTMACRVFDPAGGGVKAQGTPLSMKGETDQPLTTSGDAVRYNVVLGQIKNVGTSLPEIILLLRGLKPEICDAINVAEDIYTPGNSTIPTDNVGSQNTDYYAFSGSMDPWPVPAGIAFGTDTRLFGKRAFCYQQTVSAGYYLAYAVYSR